MQETLIALAQCILIGWAVSAGARADESALPATGGEPLKFSVPKDRSADSPPAQDSDGQPLKFVLPGSAEPETPAPPPKLKPEVPEQPKTRKPYDFAVPNPNEAQLGAEPEVSDEPVETMRELTPSQLNLPLRFPRYRFSLSGQPEYFGIEQTLLSGQSATPTVNSAGYDWLMVG
jgi:hypothetical protein